MPIRKGDVMRRWDSLMESYLAECKQRGLAQSTISNRRRELEKLGAWLKRQRPRPQLESISADLITKYIKSRSVFRSKCTVCNILTTLRTMGQYLEREGIWASNPLRWMKGPRMYPNARLPKRIGKTYLTRLWDYTSGLPEKYYRQKWLAILSVLYATGLRRGELERLDLTDLKHENGTLLVDGRKTGRERFVPLAPAAWYCIDAYLPYRQNYLEKTGCQRETALFVNRNGKRLSGISIHGGIQRLTKRANLPHVTLHQFRHTCASDLLENGALLPEVQLILGHEYIASTMRYVHVNSPERRNAMVMHPINDMLEGDKNEALVS